MGDAGLIDVVAVAAAILVMPLTAYNRPFDRITRGAAGNHADGSAGNGVEGCGVTSKRAKRTTDENARCCPAFDAAAAVGIARACSEKRHS